MDVHTHAFKRKSLGKKIQCVHWTGLVKIEKKVEKCFLDIVYFKGLKVAKEGCESEEIQMKKIDSNIEKYLGHHIRWIGRM